MEQNTIQELTARLDALTEENHRLQQANYELIRKLAVAVEQRDEIHAEVGVLEEQRERDKLEGKKIRFVLPRIGSPPCRKDAKRVGESLATIGNRYREDYLKGDPARINAFRAMYGDQTTEIYCDILRQRDGGKNRIDWALANDELRNTMRIWCHLIRMFKRLDA